MGFAALWPLAYGSCVSLRAQMVLFMMLPLFAMGATSKDAAKSRKNVTTAIATDRPAHTNRLAREKSPYLL